MAGAAKVIPCLPLWGDNLVTTTCFRRPQRAGPPIDAVRMLDRAGAEELILLDIAASRKHTRPQSPDLGLIARISDECCMPLTYGGGIRTMEDVRDILDRGVENVMIGTRAVEDPSFIARVTDVFGSRNVAVAIDVKRLPDGRYVACSNGGAVQNNISPVEFARHIEHMGAGRIFLNSVNRDGTMQGYDLHLVESVARAVDIPVIACGGAGSMDDFAAAIRAGASAAAASSIFLFRDCLRATHISYPTRREIESMRNGVPEASVEAGR